MNDEPSIERAKTRESELLDRRLFLRSIGKWSGAAVLAAVAGGVWLSSAPEAKAGVWVNRRGFGGGGWVNRGGGGGWINRGGGGGWINRGGGGGWINRGVGGGWINRRVGVGGGWINRPIGGGSAWVNRW
jgi:hypothetical protein